ncbi:GDP-mannose 4,6-dehydratase [Candidatus Woesearchaeota archaeon]|nr:GDP-mannose 4,6-dehydratase [Candidatus Woesearchaeota archaeon]
MNWKNLPVLVTGADGFIGSWIAKELIEQGAEVYTIVRDIKKQSNLDVLNLRNKINIVHGDLANFDVCNRVLKEYKIVICFHIAAQAIVGIANDSPLSTFESNIKGTWNILEAARLSKFIKGVIVASSDKAYGVQKRLPYTEESPLLGLYPYDASKACADILSRSYFKTYGLAVAVTRNANTYGGADLNFSRLIPDTIKSVINNQNPIIRSDGTPERDYMYIKDAVNAYLKLASNINRKDVQGEAFNFGTSKPISVLELYNKIINLMGKKIKPKILGNAKNEIDKQYLSIEKAKRVLKWQPKYSIEQGLRETIAWYRQFFKKN